MKVEIGKLFGRELLNFPPSDQLKIKNFIKHVQAHGLNNLEGRNKNSDNVPTDDKDFVKKVKLAQAHRLWHYHIGIVDYDMTKSFGDRTSEYVLHYKNELSPGELRIIDFSTHPPFRPPTPPYLEE
ncbi:Putative phage associated protein [Sodalis praecaptivus]|uniref:Putative phage associated protein n=1 Tax=Sodalis praecaptivus TaxID=1239307 RepID=W0HVS9_9GAMM|nr:hypothetical protein [Sodalis praecaptivus]AHF77936.1 Putative phage associated protein [Sodalis praecaptivus]